MCFYCCITKIIIEIIINFSENSHITAHSAAGSKSGRHSLCSSCREADIQVPAKPSSYLEVLGKTYFQACRSSAEFRSSRPANRGLLFLAGRQSGAPLRSPGRLSGPFHWPLHLKPARACQSFSRFKSLTSSSASGHRTLFLNDLTQWSPTFLAPMRI